MAELITHEVQVAAIDGRSSSQTNHLVQGNASVNHIVFITLLEVPVHISIYQAEDDGLVAYQCLVMALAVRDVWQHRDIAKKANRWKGTVKAHETKVFVLK
jgi:hypothetical protein